MGTADFNNALISLRAPLMSFALQLTYNKIDAEDLYQETVTKALINKSKFVSFSNLRAWTYTIMKNTFINDYRKKNVRKTVFDNSEDQHVLHNVSHESQQSPDGVLNEKHIWNQINTLEPGIRDCFVMHFEGYKYQEIAEEMNIPIGTVKSRIFIARKMLNKKLTRH